MGITLFTFSGLFGPLQHLAGWLVGASPPLRAAAAPVRVDSPPGWQRGGRVHRSRPGAARGAVPARRPLRVVRVLDACHAPSSAGRMVISGRMADVCAELDRLAAQEHRGA